MGSSSSRSKHRPRVVSVSATRVITPPQTQTPSPAESDLEISNYFDSSSDSESFTEPASTYQPVLNSQLLTSQPPALPVQLSNPAEPSEKKNAEKQIDINCISCNEKLNKDHLGIKCLQNHAICQECAPSYIDNIFANPQETIPPKCPQCTAEIILSTFEMQLDANKSAQFNNIMLCITILEKDGSEVVLHCPFCNYYEIRDKNGINFVFCSKENCRKRSCYFCYLECPYSTALSDDSDDDEDFQDPEAQKHFDCAMLHPIKQKIEKAIEDGNKVRCPKCGTGGRKDDACTHMKCVKCGATFCYFCGKEESECEKEAGALSIYGHNANWPDHENRCPMYLSELADVDDRWPIDDEQCLDFFHRIKIMTNLRKVINENSLTEIERIEERYKCIGNMLFTIEDVMTEDLRMIIRD